MKRHVVNNVTPKSLALGCIDTAPSATRTQLEIEILGQRKKATVLLSRLSTWTIRGCGVEPSGSERRTLGNLGSTNTELFEPALASQLSRS